MTPDDKADIIVPGIDWKMPEELQLSERDKETIVGLLLNPPEPSERLKRAAKEYARVVER